MGALTEAYKQNPHYEFASEISRSNSTLPLEFVIDWMDEWDKTVAVFRREYDSRG